jgi:hypothetical protein
MIRAILFAVLASVFLAAVIGISPWFFLVPIGGLMIYAYTFGGFKLKCPACGKRIKLGYTSCHHCGRALTLKGG